MLKYVVVYLLKPNNSQYENKEYLVVALTFTAAVWVQDRDVALSAGTQRPAVCIGAHCSWDVTG